MVFSRVFLLDGHFTVSGGSVTGTCTDNSGIIYSFFGLRLSGRTLIPGYNSIRPFRGLSGDGTDLIFDNQLSPWV